MIEYKLTDDEIQYINDLAKRRNDAKRRYKVKTKKMHKSASDFEIHRIGITGELAFAKLFNLVLDDDVGPKGDNGNDLYFNNGLSVQVKTRTRMNYEFLVDTDSLHGFRSDIGVLMYLLPKSPTSVFFVGWTDRVKFAAKHILNNFGHGKRLVLANKYLRSPESLLRVADIFNEMHDSTHTKLHMPNAYITP